MKRFFSKIWGYILFGIAKFLDVVLGGLNKGISFLVRITERVRKLIAPSFGCIIVLLLFNPLSFLFLIRTWLWIPLLIIFIFPLLGSSFVSFLEYWKYVLCEFLYDKSDDFIKGTSKGQIFGAYGDRYKRKKAAEKEAEQKRKFAEEEAARERRRQQQQEQWRKIFEDFFGGFAGGAGSYGQYGGYGQGQYGQGSSYNPAADFNRQYRNSCDALGISYNTDEYQVKLAYRKKAKEYHPDINKSANATEKFQEVSSAYEFLSQENIDRYKRLNNL